MISNPQLNGSRCRHHFSIPLTAAKVCAVMSPSIREETPSAPSKSSATRWCWTLPAPRAELVETRRFPDGCEHVGGFACPPSAKREAATSISASLLSYGFCASADRTISRTKTFSRPSDCCRTSVTSKGRLASRLSVVPGCGKRRAGRVIHNNARLSERVDRTHRPRSAARPRDCHRRSSPRILRADKTLALRAVIRHRAQTGRVEHSAGAALDRERKFSTSRRSWKRLRPPVMKRPPGTPASRSEEAKRNLRPRHWVR